MLKLLLAVTALAAGSNIEVSNDSGMVVMGGLEKQVISDTIGRQAPKIRACEKLYATKKTRIMLRFVITNKGKVRHLGITSESRKIPRLDRCVKSVLRDTIFPEPQGGGVVEVDYPMELGKK